MTSKNFFRITSQYSKLRIAVVGDFCLDRYLEIDPSKAETSIETGLPVRNVIKVRSQAGAAGTVLNNLVALGVGKIFPVGFRGEDGEGYELQQTLAALPGVEMDYFLATSLCRTFCYCKPLVLEPGKPPRELERLDSKNWIPTPAIVIQSLLKSLDELRGKVDAVVIMDQVSEPEAGTVTAQIRDALVAFLPGTLVIADSRRGLAGYPPVIFKMNAAELRLFMGLGQAPGLVQVQEAARKLAKRNGQAVIITMAEHGIMGIQPDGSVEQVPALLLRGPIDIVGAGDAVTANATAALAAGASLKEAIELAAVGSSIVIHQLGTTGTASVEQLRELMFSSFAPFLPKQPIGEYGKSRDTQ